MLLDRIQILQWTGEYLHVYWIKLVEERVKWATFLWGCDLPYGSTAAIIFCV